MEIVMAQRRRLPQGVQVRSPGLNGVISPAAGKKTLLDNLRPSPEIEALWAGTTSPEEDAALDQIIEVSGAVLPIVADDHGNIIDGHRCYRTYQRHNVKEVFVVVLMGLTDEEKQQAVALNSNRRSLSMDHKKTIMWQFLRENAKLSARYLGRILGVDHKTAQAVKNEMVAGGEIPHLDEIEGQDGKTYKAQGALTPLRHIKRTLNELSKAKELPAVVTPKRVRSQIARERRAEAAQIGATLTDPPDARLIHCDFRELLIREPGIEKSAGLILTDPPYGKDYLWVWKQLAVFAKKVLLPGGWLVTYAGTNYLDQVFAALASELHYVWTSALLFTQSGSYSQYGSLNIFQLWRPVLLFHNGNPDSCRIATNIADRFPLRKPEKDWHDWQQPLPDMVLLVKTFSLDGDLVVDPFGGGFTTACACKQVGRRRFLGCDILNECVDVGRYRLNIQAAMI
jgi:ParB-like chromosome segregation protein Spo0J